MKTFTTYVFKTHDPIMEELRSVVVDSGLKIKQISECGVAPSTIRSWFKKKTRRPQFATISAVALSLGVTGVKFVDGKPVLVLPPRKLKVVQGGKK